MTRARMLGGLGAALVLLLCGCTTLPDTGAVHTRSAGSEETPAQVPYFAPPGPSRGDGPESIVRGFLLAMQANPPSTAVARSFLSDRAKATWKPNEGTIVYDAVTVEAAGSDVTVRLRGAHRLAPAGEWLDGTSADTRTEALTLSQADGQWRIDDPPNVLAVPASYFSNLFVPFDLFFFDRTGTTLVGTKVYVPRGEQTATNLVRGLLAGPPPALSDVAVSALPAPADRDLLAVVVNDAGIAEVPLGPAVLRLAPADLNRLVVQLSWTLRQVPGINRLRITVDGAPVSLSAGRTDVSVSDADFDPLTAPDRDLLAISDGRVLRDDRDRGTPVGGPLGQPGFKLRSLAWNARGHLLAAVTGDGHRVFVAPDRGAHAESRVRTALDGGADLLRPAYDRFGGLWVVDRSRDGAVVHLLRGGKDRVVRVPGVTGRRVSAFTVTRDGAALVAVLATGTNPTVEVSQLVRRPDGRLVGATSARTLQLSGIDLGPAEDVAQNSPTSVAVLTRAPSGGEQIVFVELDGSPGDASAPLAGAPATVPDGAQSLVASQDPVLPLRVVTADGHLYTYTESGTWVRATMSSVGAAAYAQ